MMAGKGCVVLQTAAGWSVTATELDASDAWGECTPAELAERVAAFVAARRLPPNRIVLAVWSQSVLSATFTLPIADQRDRRTLVYQLESRLPVAAEDIAADFIRAGAHVLGVSIAVNAWLPVISELESRGLRVQTISPAALLALQSLVKQPGCDGYHLIVWQDGAETELWRIDGEHVTSWQHLAADSREVANHLAAESLAAGKPLRAVAVNGPAGLDVELDRLGLSELTLTTRETKRIAAHAAEQAQALLRGTEAPWIELRRGALAAGDPYRGVRGSLRLLVAAAAIFLLAVAGASFIKDWQNHHELAELTSQQAEQFRDAFPGTRVPAAVVARMKSEHAKLHGSRNATEDVKVPTPALRVLLELLRAMPGQERFVVRELRIEDGQIDLDVDLPQHGSVNGFVESLEASGFTVNAPATVRQDDGSVSCRIFGDLQMAGLKRAENSP